MKTLDRYMGQQLLFATTVGVAVLSVVLVLGNVFKQLLELLINRSAPPEFIFTFISYILPFSMTFTIPWGFLTAVLLVFGRMSAEHEITALRSSGISITRMSLMVFVVAAVCAGCCMWINVDVAPKAQTRMKQALYELATSRPLAMFDSDKVIDAFPGHKIYIGRSDGDQLFNLLVYELNAEGEPMKVIYAKRGLLHPDAVNRRLLLDLYDARYEQRDEASPQTLSRIRQGITIQKTTLPISLEELYERSKKGRTLSSLTIGELKTRLETDENAGQKPPKERAADASELRTEVSKRFSFALASLAFGLIAIPLAVTAQRKETSVGFLLSLAVAFAYFFMIIMVQWVKRKPDWHPELLMWLPNLIFFSLGAFMFRRLARR
jgi:lipopolysaccharide export LptBFGC system permease protein LptF